MSETNEPTPKNTVEIPSWLLFKLESLAENYNLDKRTIVATAVIKELAALNIAFKQNTLDSF